MLLALLFAACSLFTTTITAGSHSPLLKEITEKKVEQSTCLPEEKLTFLKLRTLNHAIQLNVLLNNLKNTPLSNFVRDITLFKNAYKKEAAYIIEQAHNSFVIGKIFLAKTKTTIPVLTEIIQVLFGRNLMTRDIHTAACVAITEINAIRRQINRC